MPWLHITLLLGLTATNILWYIHAHKLRKLANKSSETKLTVLDWGHLATGVSGDYEIEVNWLRTAQELFEIFCMKQHDYGPDNIAVGGTKGVALRMGDKMSRLWNLTGLSTGGKEQAGKVSDESLVDTFLDHADYGIIGAMVARGQWKVLTPEEAWSLQDKEPLIDSL